MKSKTVYAKNVPIGGGNRVTVQTMLNIPLNDTIRVINEIHALENAGCEILRTAIPDEESVEALKNILPEMSIPMVADIHFNWRLAIKSVEAGVSKLRINPGNIGGKDKLKEVCACLKEYKIPVRIGVNGGSLEKDILQKHGSVCSEALVESAMRSIGYFNEFGYDDIVVSIKASDVVTTYEANKLFFSRYDYPIHLGITEAGSSLSGIIRSSAGIGAMLLNGIGDTIRVSLTASPIEEIIAGKEILNACGMRREGVNVISCPTCARCTTDTLSIVTEIKEKTKHIKPYICVAVMGCVVNGPGESKEADIGVACCNNKGLLFKNGASYKTVDEKDITKVLLDEINTIACERSKQCS